MIHLVDSRCRALQDNPLSTSASPKESVWVLYYHSVRFASDNKVIEIEFTLKDWAGTRTSQDYRRARLQSQQWSIIAYWPRLV